MKTSLVLLSLLFCSNAAIGADAVRELSPHLGKTPALVVVVCGGQQRCDHRRRA